MIVQTAFDEGAGVAAPVLEGVTEGNSIVAVYVQNGTNVRTYSAESDVDGAMEPVVTYHPSGAMGCFVLHNVTEGDHTITVQANTGTVGFAVWLFELEGLNPDGTPIIPVGNGYTDPAASDDHYSSATPGLSNTGGGFVVSFGRLVSTVTSTSAGSGYTKATTASTTQRFCQYRLTESAITNDRGHWISSGTDRVGESSMVIFPLLGDEGGGGEDPPPETPTAPRWTGAFFL